LAWRMPIRLWRCNRGGAVRAVSMEGVRAAMKTRHLEADQWLNRKEWCLGSGRRRQLSQDQKDREIDRKHKTCLYWWQEVRFVN
jgi:hypothetical protein